MEEFKASFNSEDVEITSHEVAYQGVFQISKYELKHRLHRGGWSEPYERELFQRGHAVGILPYDPERDEVVLLEQFRIGALADPDSPWLFEIAAGVIDEGESPQETAIRELHEETGLECLDLLPIMTYWVSPGGTDEKMSLYCARVDSSHAGGIYGMEDENEEIRVIKLPRQRVMGAIKNDRLRNAPIIITNQWLELNLQSVRDLWLGETL